MKTLRPLSQIVLLAAILGGAGAACSDDDDSAGSDPTGGRPASGGVENQGGKSSTTGGTAGATGKGGGAMAGGAGLGGRGPGGNAGMGGDSGDAAAAGMGGAGFDAPPESSDFPPTSTAAAVVDWLDQEFYLDWACEDSNTVKDDGAPAIHVHGVSSRVCSNVLLATSRSGGEFPAGVAAVKEVYDEDDQIIARMVSAKAHPDSAEGDGWFWSDGGTLAGFGRSECTGCHAASGSDADHPGAGDFVYFQVQNEAELPPTDDPASIPGWLEAGFYQSWTCEEEPTDKTAGAAAIHVHRVNRICSNARLAALPSLPASGWPAGISSVKEVYDGDSLSSIDLYVKVNADSDEGNGFFYYGGESLTGFGFDGCVGCHSAAGADADHPGAGDFVYERMIEP
jgi:hypothetical protein